MKILPWFVLLILMLGFVISGCKKQDKSKPIVSRIVNINKPKDTSEVMRWIALHIDRKRLYTMQGTQPLKNMWCCMADTIIFRADSSVVISKFSDYIYRAIGKYQIKDSNFWLLDINYSSNNVYPPKGHVDSIH